MERTLARHPVHGNVVAVGRHVDKDIGRAGVGADGAERRAIGLAGLAVERMAAYLSGRRADEDQGSRKASTTMGGEAGGALSPCSPVRHQSASAPASVTNHQCIHQSHKPEHLPIRP